MNDAQAVESALAALDRNDDGSVDEKSLIEAVAELIDFDADAEKMRRAKAAVHRLRRPGSTAPAGQLTFPALLPYSYEPARLIADNEGHVVEQAAARPEFKRAEAERARLNARRASEWANRKTGESEAYAAWAIEQLLRGRGLHEVTFDNFVRESGVWSDGEAEVESDGGEAA